MLKFGARRKLERRAGTSLRGSILQEHIKRFYICMYFFYKK